MSIRRISVVVPVQRRRLGIESQNIRTPPWLTKYTGVRVVEDMLRDFSADPNCFTDAGPPTAGTTAQKFLNMMASARPVTVRKADRKYVRLRNICQC